MMKKDTKLLIASLVFLAISLTMMLIDMWYSLNLWWLGSGLFLCYSVLFFFFLYYNHEEAKNDTIKIKSLAQYRIGIMIWSAVLLIGIILALIGSALQIEILIWGWYIASLSIFPLIYCIFGWDDIRRKGTP